jgi:hypothetical protein
MTQRDMILDFMQRNGGITPLEALEHIGCMRLASRIGELRKRGYDIRSETVYHTNDYGERKHYSRYTLEA